jgi:hypothetical protein
MGRTRSLFSHLPKLEPDGVTHRRDCECVRCDAGFRPTEQDRTRARLRWEVEREHAAAERMLARRRERAAVRSAALALELEAEARAVNDRLRTLREARARADNDPRLALLERLRAAGVPLADALAEVEKEERVGGRRA